MQKCGIEFDVSTQLCFRRAHVSRKRAANRQRIKFRKSEAPSLKIYSVKSLALTFAYEIILYAVYREIKRGIEIFN